MKSKASNFPDADKWVRTAAALALKDIRGLTNAQLAKQCGVSIRLVEKVARYLRAYPGATSEYRKLIEERFPARDRIERMANLACNNEDLKVSFQALKYLDAMCGQLSEFERAKVDALKKKELPQDQRPVFMLPKGTKLGIMAPDKVAEAKDVTPPAGPADLERLRDGE